MKYLILLLPFITLPANAITWKEFWEPFENREYHHRPSYYTPTCTQVVYREQYIPGNEWRPGYVRYWKERIKVPCSSIH